MTAAQESLGDWLDPKLESVPQELGVRIRAVLPSDWRDVPVAEGSALLTDVAAHELRGLLERGCEQRWAAPGLLVVDALITYACELASFSGSDIASSTAVILNTIAATLPPEESIA